MCKRNVTDLKRPSTYNIHSTHNIWNFFKLCFKPIKKIVNRKFLEKLKKELGMGVHAFHSGPQEVEAGGFPGVLGQPGLPIETLSPKQTNNNETKTNIGTEINEIRTKKKKNPAQKEKQNRYLATTQSTNP